MRKILLAPIFSFCICYFTLAEKALAGAPAEINKTESTKGDSKFEGSLSMSMAMETGNGEMELFIAGDKIRLNMELTLNPMPMPILMGILLDLKTPKQATLISDQTQTYSNIPIPETLPPSGPKTLGKYDVKVMGDTTLLGYTCSHIALKRDKELIDTWITKGLPDMYSALKRLQLANPQIGEAAIFQALEESGHAGMPMRYRVVRDGQKVSMEVKKVSRQKIPATQFAIPMGYVENKMGKPGLGDH